MNLPASLHILVILCASVALFGLTGCDQGGDDSADNTGAEAESFGLEECTSCGMVVREQPAPRGQAVHRDGTRKFFCALSDLLYYIETPSPHGQITDIFVEVLPADADPSEPDPSERDWLEAEKAQFIVGVDRPHVMGRPVLAYSPEVDVATLAERFDGQVVEWEELADHVIHGDGHHH